MRHTGQLQNLYCCFLDPPVRKEPEPCSLLIVIKIFRKQTERTDLVGFAFGVNEAKRRAPDSVLARRYRRIERGQYFSRLQLLRGAVERNREIGGFGPTASAYDGNNRSRKRQLKCQELCDASLRASLQCMVPVQSQTMTRHYQFASA